MKAILFLLAFASFAHGQLMLTSEHVPAFTLVQLNKGQYEFVRVKAESIPDLEPIDLEMSPDQLQYRFPDNTAPGKYRVVATAFDPKLGIGEQTIKVEIGKVNPVNPVDPVNPTDPVIPDDPTESKLTKESRLALRTLVEAMAQNFETQAKRFEEGKYATVRNSFEDGVLLDIEARNKFKQVMGVQMGPRLGVDQLPPDTAAIFREIAKGFRGVR